MIPAECDYHRAETTAEALDLLAAHGDREVELLAGGHGLLPAMKRGDRAPDVLVDVGHVDGLAGVEPAGDGVAVGALTRHADLADDGRLREAVPELAEAAGEVGDTQVRNRGTIGGNLADAEADADLPAAALAADAVLEVRGPEGEREIPAAEFFVGPAETALGPDELLTRIRLPADADAGAYVRKTNPARGYALVGVAAAVGVERGVVTTARLGVTGVTERPRRLPAVEEAVLDASVGDLSPTEAAARAADDLADATLRDGVHASAEYRAELLPTYVERALATAFERAGAGVASPDGAANGGGGA